MSPYFIKDPEAVLDYSIDWSRWLGADTIESSQWIVPAGLVQVSASHTTTETTVWISGGTVGQSYPVTNRITTAGGRTEDRTITIKVEER